MKSLTLLFLIACSTAGLAQADAAAPDSAYDVRVSASKAAKIARKIHRAEKLLGVTIRRRSRAAMKYACAAANMASAAYIAGAAGMMSANALGNCPPVKRRPGPAAAHEANTVH